MQLKRPILVGGLGLSASLWLLNIVGHSPVGHAFGDGSALMGAIALGTGLWFFKKSRRTELVVEPPLALGVVDKAAIENVIAEIETTISTLKAECLGAECLGTECLETNNSNNANWQQQVEVQIAEKTAAIAQLYTNLDRDQLNLAIIGNKSTGKTALKHYLNEHWQSQSFGPENITVENIAEINGEETLPTPEADLVLFVTAGDLTQSELQRLQTLLKAGYRVQIAFNKQDQLTPADKQSVLQRIQTRVEALGIGVSAIAAQPKPIKVRRHQEDGTIQESTEQPGPQLTSLTDKLTHLVTEEAEQLIFTTTLRQAKALKASTQQLLNAQRKRRAMPIVEQMQWVAAGSAFASPLPSLDLLASTAINAQLIVDLGAIYDQTFSLEQGKKAAATLAELLVKLGIVELSTQAFGSLLKTHAATYVAGGALQGISAAYLTRTVGLSLIDFFEEQSLLPADKQKFVFSEMGDRLQTIFKATKQGLGLQSFVQQALSKLPTAENSVSVKTAVAQ